MGASCTRAKGGEKDERWLNECASNSRELALLSFLPCHRKTKRPRFFFSALTPVSSLVLSLPPLLFSLYTDRDGPSGHSQPIGDQLCFSAQQCTPTQTHTHRKREREINSRRKKACNRMLVWVRGKVYMTTKEKGTNIMTIRLPCTA